MISLSAQPAHEIRWPTSIVSERYNVESIGETCKHHVIWKRMDGHPANVLIRNSWNQPTDPWKALDELESPSSLGDESIRNTRISVTVPLNHFAVFVFRRFGDVERVQRPSTSFSTRSSTVRQSVLASSPARAAATRL